MSIKQLLVIFAFCFALLIAADFASAQGTTSRLTGTVTDSSGAAVSGATVTITNEGTQISLTTETSDSGNYAFDLIPAGTYRVTIEKTGFKKLVSSKNAVNVNQPATVNIALEVGDVSATVNVESTVEEVQTSSSGNIGSTIEQRTLESLPIVGTRGRNPLDLLNYQPGVVNGANTGGGVHVNGSRDRAFNFTLDGIDINESSAGGSNFTPLRPNPDSLQEFQVVTSNFTAELGRSSGAQVTFITRTGTNRITGNLFEYYQTPRFNAAEYTNNLNGRTKSQFVQHIFGGSFGGPLVVPGFGEGTPVYRVLKDKAFFFTNIQLLRAYDTALVSRTVYTQSARSGVFRFVQGFNAAGTSALQNTPAGATNATVNASGAALLPNCGAGVALPCINQYNLNTNTASVGFDPTLTGIFNAAPLPNNFSGGDGLNYAGFDFLAPQRERQYDFTSRFDYKISDNKQMYVRYSQGEQNTFGDSGNGGRPIFPGSPRLVDTFRNPKNLAINFRYSPTARLTNEFIFGINKFAFAFDTPAEANNPNIFFGNNNSVSTTLNNSIAVPQTNFTYNARRLRTLQFVDNVTYALSKHIIKAGINFRFGRQIDDRSSVGGTSTEISPVVDFSTSVNNSFTAFNLPASAVTGTTPVAGINSTDLSNLRGTINNFLGRVGNYRLAFVADPNNPTQFAPAGTRYGFTAYYPEYDFYVQDTWRARRNLVFDLGLRYEAKLSPTSDGSPILAPDRQINFGAPAANNVKFVESKLFKNDFNNFGPSVGFAYDPFKNGKTSIRANYRLSYDRFPSQLFSGNIFQSIPGNTFGASNSTFGQGGGLLRNGLPSIAPTTTPDALRLPAAFSTNSLTIIDSDLRYPEVHEWSLSFQRELFGGFVFEADYIGKKGVHLFGGYDVNQVNLSASDPRCPGETFLSAFKSVQAGATSSCLLNYLTTGANQTGNTGTATFRSQFATQLTQNSVAAAAQTIAQRSGTTSLTANGFSPFFFQKFPQFSGALNVLDSNDISFYNGLQLVVKRRFSKGLGFQFGYTFSKSMDTRSFDPTFSTVSRSNAQSASSTPFDLNNRRLNYAPSDFDRRHVFQATYVYELPLGKGRTFGKDIPKALDLIIGGWQIAGNLLVSSGRPFTVYSGANTLSNVVQSPANCNGCDRHLGSVVQENGTNYFFDTAQRAMFSIPDVGSIGNTGRNYFIGPRFYQTDVSLSKKFKVTERYSFDLRVDARNLTNTPSFDIPTATFTSTTFGRIRDGVVSNARRIQFSGKLNF